MKFRFAMKKYFYISKNLFTLVFIVGKMKSNFVLGVVGVKRSIKNVNKPERDIETSMLVATMQEFIDKFYIKSTQ